MYLKVRLREYFLSPISALSTPAVYKGRALPSERRSHARTWENPSRFKQEGNTPGPRSAEAHRAPPPPGGGQWPSSQSWNGVEDPALPETSTHPYF